jgi:hypothetical protein
MKNPIRYIMCLALSAPLLYAQVNTNELQQGQGTIEFYNNTGPVARVDTVSQIRNIGFEQGAAIRRGLARSGAATRYFVIHSVSPTDGQRMDADIFGLGTAVGVDHIRNLRLIIQGYLEGAYNYTAQDARLLAQYITVYNAVYRGNWAFFNTRYKQAVLSNLTPERVGLPLRFNEWPGRTLIVIPLGNAAAGSLSAIDTSAISDDSVLQDMRETPDQALDSRKAMVGLKEREADEAENKATTLREAIADEEARIAAERERIAAARQKAREDAAAGRISAEEARRLEQELADRENALNKDEEALNKRRMEADELEKLAEDKMNDAQRDRAGIAADQTPTPAEVAAAAKAAADKAAADKAAADKAAADKAAADKLATDKAAADKAAADKAAADKAAADKAAADQAAADKAAADKAAADKAAADAAAAAAGTPVDQAAADQAAADKAAADKAAADKAAADKAAADKAAADKAAADKAAADKAAADKLAADKAAADKAAADKAAADAAAAAAPPPPSDGVQANENSGGTSVLMVAPANANSPLGPLVLVSVATGRVTDTSTLTAINARSLTSVGEGANEKFFATITLSPANKVQLIQIDKEEMSAVAQMDSAVDSLDPNSPLWVQGNLIYAIVKTGAQFNLACFNTAAVKDGVIPLAAKSGIAVHPFAAVNFQGDTLIVQRPNGEAAVLRAQDLTEQ